MGSFFSRIFGALFGSKEVRILILGLDNAGKTTILCKFYSSIRSRKVKKLKGGYLLFMNVSVSVTVRLQVDQPITTVPTIGFNVETLQYKNIKFQVWDLGGQSSIRPYWRCYYPNTDAIIFVVDSADKERLETARQVRDLDSDIFYWQNIDHASNLCGCRNFMQCYRKKI